MGDENRVMGDRNTKSKQPISIFYTYTVPTCVTNVVSPFGRLIKVLRVAVIEVKHDMEWTIWLVAHVSITQSVSIKIFLPTVLAKKIECFKVETKGTLGLVPHIKAKLKLRLVYAKVSTTSEIEPEASSPPMAMQEMLTLAA